MTTNHSELFPSKLRHVLSNPELHDIISWNPDGLSWRIHKPKLFVDTVISQYFEGQSSFSSFTRQLNSWGFKRVGRGSADKGTYYQRYFLRDFPDLMHRMKRNESSHRTCTVASSCIPLRPVVQSGMVTHLMPHGYDRFVHKYSPQIPCVFPQNSLIVPSMHGSYIVTFIPN